MKYAILYNPGHNRVYFETSLKLSVSELKIASGKLSSPCLNLERKTIGGVDYLEFETEKELEPKDVQIISNLSFVYAIFKLDVIDESPCLFPMEKTSTAFIDESLGTMLKYTGKTNEIFTRMMINVAVHSLDNCGSIKLLDPIAGKGTTLYEGLIKGFDVYGIEIGDKVVNEAFHFVKRFLENARYKFDEESIKVSGENKSFTALRHTFKTARTKEDFKEKNIRTIELVAGNSLYANKLYKKSFFDVVVGDLPYGVQHGNVTNEKQSSLTRNPTELLRACLPSWSQVMKQGGVIALSWNSNVLPREKMVKIFESKGFSVFNEGAYLEFEHRVDQAIQRDIIVAKKI